MTAKMKMVSNFRRSLSFPTQSSSKPPPKESLHVRSTSLPCLSHSHPIISHLRDSILDLKTTCPTALACTSARLCHGLARLKAIHHSLGDLLQLSQARESLRPYSAWIEMLLQDCLRFVDAFGIFRTLILTLKEDHLMAQLALRKKDESKIASCLKNLKKMSKEMSKLSSNVKTIQHQKTSASANYSMSMSGDEAELADIIEDVTEVTVLVSTTLFHGISSAISLQKSSSIMGLKLSKNPMRKLKGNEELGLQEFQQISTESLWNLRNKGDEEVKAVLKRMYDMEDCIAGIEASSEAVFRSLINTKVSLLNVLTR